jgi:hypothetical protein
VPNAETDETASNDDVDVVEDVEDVEDADEPNDADDANEVRVARTPRRVSGFVVASIAAGVFAVLSIVLVAIVVNDHSKTDSGSGDRTEISTTAARVAEALTAVDPVANNSASATIQQLGTAPVLQQYNEINGAVQKLMAPLKLQSIRGKVQEVYVGTVDQSEATAIVRIDLILVGDSTKVQPGYYLDVSLAKLDGVWKVDNLQLLNVTLANGVPSSTVPGAPSASSGTDSSSG